MSLIFDGIKPWVPAELDKITAVKILQTFGASGIWVLLKFVMSRNRKLVVDASLFDPDTVGLFAKKRQGKPLVPTGTETSQLNLAYNMVGPGSENVSDLMLESFRAVGLKWLHVGSLIDKNLWKRLM